MAQATVLVASPKAMGTPPVASGSRVPPCPALAASSRCRTALTAWLELMPKGLSRTSQPWIGRPRRLRTIVARLVGKGQIALDLGSMQQLVDAVGMIERRVEREGEAGRKAPRHVARDLALAILGRARQPGEHLVAMPAAQRHDIGRGVLQVRTEADLGHGHGHVLQCRVAQLDALQGARERVAQLLAHPQLPLARFLVSAIAFHAVYVKCRSIGTAPALVQSCRAKARGRLPPLRSTRWCRPPACCRNSRRPCRIRSPRAPRALRP